MNSLKMDEEFTAENQKPKQFEMMLPKMAITFAIPIGSQC